MLKKIELKDSYKYFLYLFIFLLPLQTRKVFLTSHSFYTGGFTEYGTVFLYLSDVLLFLSLLLFCIFNQDIIKKRLTELKKENGNRKRLRIFIVFGLMVLWFFVSSIAHKEYLDLTLFRTAKILEMFLMIGFVYVVFQDRKIFTRSLFILILSAYFQGLLAVYQFIYQHSLFKSPLLHKLTGETVLSPVSPGIAKIVINGQKMIRSYGVFPHPNLLGGFFVLTFFVSLYLYIQHKDDKLSSKMVYLKITDASTRKYLISLFWLLIFAVQLLGLFFSFSRSAWIGFLIAGIFFIVFYLKSIKIVSRETIKDFFLNNSGRWLKTYKELLLAFSFMFVFAVININLVLNRTVQNVSLAKYEQNLVLPENDTFNDRIFFDNVSRETILKNPVIGSGPGTSIFQVQDYLNKIGQKNIAYWQYQPAHNIYLLAVSETGFIGLVLFLYVIIKILAFSIEGIVSRETILENKMLKISLLSVMISFLFIGMFDHYFLTMQQGQLMFWIVLGMLLV